MKISSRVKQHKKTIDDRKWEASGISAHGKDCNQGFLWDKVSTLKIEEKKFERKVREAFEIQKCETSPRNANGLNQDDGQYVTTSFWKPMFAYMRQKSLY